MTTLRQPGRFTEPHVSSGSDEVPTCDNLYIKQLGKGDIGDSRPLGSGRLGCLGRHSGDTSQKQLDSEEPSGSRGRLGRHSVTRVTDVTHRDWVTADRPQTHRRTSTRNQPPIPAAAAGRRTGRPHSERQRRASTYIGTHCRADRCFGVESRLSQPALELGDQLNFPLASAHKAQRCQCAAMRTQKRRVLQPVACLLPRGSQRPAKRLTGARARRIVDTTQDAPPWRSRRETP